MSFTPARVPAALGMGPRTSGPALRSRRAWGAWGGAFWADSKIRSSLCPIRKLAATACRGRRWVFCEDGLKEKEIGTSNRSAHIFARERCPPSRGGSLFLPALPRICLHRRHEISTSTRTTREGNEGRRGVRRQRSARRARRARRRARGAERARHGTGTSTSQSTNDSRQRTPVVIARHYLRVKSCCAVQQHLRYLIAQ